MPGLESTQDCGAPRALTGFTGAKVSAILLEGRDRLSGGYREILRGVAGRRGGLHPSLDVLQDPIRVRLVDLPVTPVVAFRFGGVGFGPLMGLGTSVFIRFLLLHHPVRKETLWDERGSPGLQWKRAQPWSWPF